MSDWKLLHGECVEVMASMPDCSVDAIVTDPPYGLGFMGREWDSLPPGDAWAAECLRVLKPGGHLLAFGGTRTWHRLAVAVEDAGFEIRDSIAWLYGSGFPKSLDVSKAIDAAAGAEREVIGVGAASCGDIDAGRPCGGHGDAGQSQSGTTVHSPATRPATPEAEQWDGWGTAMKPAHEPIVLARKPLSGTVAANVLEWGTGALNIDATRIGTGTGEPKPDYEPNGKNEVYGDGMGGGAWANTEGRWPANVVLDGHTAAIIDRQTGVTYSGSQSEDAKYGTGESGANQNEVYGNGLNAAHPNVAPYGDTGGASRFFYCAKAPQSERPKVDGVAHPTVKPLDLMRWLVRLVCPPGGTVLDPFAGSGTTGEACIIEGFDVVLIERTDEYLPLIEARLGKPIQPTLGGI